MKYVKMNLLSWYLSLYNLKTYYNAFFDSVTDLSFDFYDHVVESFIWLGSNIIMSSLHLYVFGLLGLLI